MKISILFALIVIILFSCKDSSNYEEFEKNWSNCRQSYDKSTTYQKMQGNWELVGRLCAECDNAGYSSTKESVIITILPDSVVKTYQNGALVNTTNFSITGESYSPKNVFFIKMPFPHGNNYTHGYVEFCKNTMAFRTSYMDGEDFFFEKIK